MTAVMVCGALGCEREKPALTSKRPDVIAGTMAIDRLPYEITACNPGHTTHTFVEIVTGAGVLRFEQQKLYWRTGATPAPGQELSCTKLDRSWGGGTRSDGTSYWRGWLDVLCPGPPRIEGRVKLECGSITPQERFQLDKNARDAKARGPAR
ncbi:MAG: hypothetical protein AB7R00_01190 [Kofleriaceae bacterium]